MISDSAFLKHGQKGTTIVEFSIVASVFFMVLFGLMEFGRVVYTFNLLQEATRSAARVAVVSDLPSSINGQCTDTIFSAVDTSLLSDLKKTDMTCVYRDKYGISTTEYNEVRYVTVSIKGLKIQLSIPGFTEGIEAPAFTTTQVAESLGIKPWEPNAGGSS
ncbi:TadE family protein [Endozoicomonas sp.]|uniref:TadE family protein n=1 Tax=Endozoicomonas sp. TaxID=1892382 RepID=UPI003AF9A8CE